MSQQQSPAPAPSPSQPDTTVITQLTDPPSSGSTSQPTPPAPAPAPAPAPSASEEELNQLREWRRATQTVMDTSAPATERLRAAETILRQQGYSDQEIESYMDQMRAQYGGAPQPEFEASELEQLEGGEDLRRQLEETRRLAEQANEAVRLQRAKAVSEQITSQVDQIVNNNPDAKVLWEALTRFHGDPAKAEAARRTIQAQVLANAKGRLLKRAQLARGFEESWIGEEVSRAFKDVHDGYRTVIGDPGQLGRAPETGGGPSGVRVVDVPEPKKGSAPAPELEKQLEDWTSNELVKLASKSSMGKTLV